MTTAPLLPTPQAVMAAGLLTPVVELADRVRVLHRATEAAGTTVVWINE